MSIHISAQDAVSAVYLIGEQEEHYEQTMQECKELLLQVTDQKMDVAFQLWTKMLEELESFAMDGDIDLKGVKLWLNVFWNEDGSIKEMVYYPKPNCKNMDFEDLSQTLVRFTQVYQLELNHTSCFSHYGSASFPVKSKRILVDPK